MHYSMLFQNYAYSLSNNKLIKRVNINGSLSGHLPDYTVSGGVEFGGISTKNGWSGRLIL